MSGVIFSPSDVLRFEDMEGDLRNDVMELSECSNQNIEQELRSLPIQDMATNYKELRGRFMNFLSLQLDDETQVQSEISEISKMEREFIKHSERLEQLKETHEKAKNYKKQCGEISNRIRTSIDKARRFLSEGTDPADWNEQNHDKLMVFKYFRTLQAFQRKHQLSRDSRCEMSYHKPNREKVKVCPSCERGVCKSCSTEPPFLKTIFLCHGCYERFASFQQEVREIEINNENYEFYKRFFEVNNNQLQTLNKCEQICIALLSNYEKCQSLMLQAEHLIDFSKDFETKCRKLKEHMIFRITVLRTGDRIGKIGMGMGFTLIPSSLVLKFSGLGLELHKKLIAVSSTYFSRPLAPLIIGVGVLIAGGGFAVKQLTGKVRRTVSPYVKFIPMEIEIL